MCGVGITLNVNKDGCFFVKGLAEGGAAAKQGSVMAGDVLTAVDGETVEAQLPYSELVKKISGPSGQPITLTFRRGDGVVEATIVRSPLAAKAQVAVKKGLEAESINMVEIKRQNQAFQAQKDAMQAEILALREQVQQGKLEIDVWKQISTQNSGMASRRGSPGESPARGAIVEDESAFYKTR
ncbi:hypothetical protein T484DRAFT_2401176 [Baffinella frigidus]|nr:hypothetical protein T484DRAFT_2401176 [Cryptophyta sp. CCMP2293]